MTCPNCGQEFEGGRCPHCGRPNSRTANRIVAVLFAIFLAMPCAAFGACSVWMGIGSSGASGGVNVSFLMLSLAAGSIAALIGMVTLIGRLWRG